MENKKAQTSTWFAALQEMIIKALEQLEDEAPPLSWVLDRDAPGRFERTVWTRPEGGGGQMAILRGRLFEKAGVHFSRVHGQFPPEFASRIPGATQDPRFWASGVSLIIHPYNPHIPTIHMNTRFVVTTKSWFGGGIDLTPMLPARRNQDDPDTLFLHKTLQNLCDQHKAVAPYARFKEWCDTYFMLKHRNEMRGVGGIFYDDLQSTDFEADFTFTQEVGKIFAPLYTDIVRRNWETPWNEADRKAQLLQRGRYVEFNLLYDRGTIFGLQTGGNVESILSSMPPMVAW